MNAANRQRTMDEALYRANLAQLSMQQQQAPQQYLYSQLMGNAVVKMDPAVDRLQDQRSAGMLGVLGGIGGAAGMLGGLFGSLGGKKH